MSGRRYAAVVTWTTGVLFFAVAALIAIVIPYHASDALTFGEWSRLIAQNGHFHQAAATVQEYGRPLFYVLQGWMWHVVGVGEPSGRILSGVFSLVLVVALTWLVRDGPLGGAASALVVVATLATADFARYVVAGLTDIPSAALVCVAAALVWGRRRPGPVAAGGAGVAAALAVLAKPSAILSLVGLIAAQLLARDTWRGRLTGRAGPLAGGLLVGLVYDVIEARHVHASLHDFISSGVTTPYYRALAAAARRAAVLDVGWLGDGVRVALLFALAYAVLRLAALRHHVAVAAAVPAALAAGWLLPWIGARESHLAVGWAHSAGAAVIALGTAAFLALAARASADAQPSRRELVRFLVWAIPTFVSWAIYATYDTRLLAPAWPALLALVAVTAAPAAVVLAQRPRLAAVPFALGAIVVAYNVYNLDGLQRSGWDQLRRTPTSRWGDRNVTRAIVLPALNRALAAARPHMAADGRLFSPEGAFRFFFPGRVEQSFPTKCADLAQYRVFVLLTDEGSKSYMQNFLHVSGEPSFWGACTSPRLHQLTDGSDGYAVFSVES